MLQKMRQHVAKNKIQISKNEREEMLRIVIAGEPIAQMRPRMIIRNSQNVCYDPQKAEKKEVQRQINEQLQQTISTMPEILIEMAQAQAFRVELCHSSHPNKKDVVWLKNWEIFDFTISPTRPDLDNYIKFTLDCCNGLLWKDDSMITQIIAQKRYSRNPYTEIKVTPLKDLTLPENVKKILFCFNKETINNFMKDAKKISEIYPVDALEDLGDDRKIQWALATSRVLKEFSLKYSDILRKVKKINE